MTLRLIGLAGLAVSFLGTSPPAALRLEPLDAVGVTDLRRGDGEAIRLVSVWATWCGPCVVELPDLATLAGQVSDSRFQITTVTVDVADDEQKALALLEKHRVPGRRYRFTGELNELAAVLDPAWDGALPFALLLGPDGTVLVRSTGPLPSERIREAIAGLPAVPLPRRSPSPTPTDGYQPFRLVR